jgi:hypothetical protein
MLQRVEAEIGHARGFRVAVDAEDATFLVQLVCEDIHAGLNYSGFTRVFTITKIIGEFEMARASCA